MASRSRPKWLIWVVAAAAIALPVGIGFAAEGFGLGGASGDRAKVTGAQHRPRCPFKLLPHIEPAQIFPNADPIVSDDVMTDLTNGWTVESHRRATLIIAGLAGTGPSGSHRSKGRVAILREHYYRCRQPRSTLDLVDVPHAGAVTITRAPLGRKVVTTAQRRGVFWFVGRQGVHGKLHLKDGTVTITHVP